MSDRSGEGGLGWTGRSGEIALPGDFSRRGDSTLPGEWSMRSFLIGTSVRGRSGMAALTGRSQAFSGSSASGSGPGAGAAATPQA